MHLILTLFEFRRNNVNNFYIYNYLIQKEEIIKNYLHLGMLKIFRNFRRKYLEEGKTFGYLKYAIGEIFLVVVGILIALQINNWNETRKRTNSEHQILTTIKNSLVNDTLMFRDAANNARRSNSAIKFLLTKPVFQNHMYVSNL